MHHEGPLRIVQVVRVLVPHGRVGSRSERVRRKGPKKVLDDVACLGDGATVVGDHWGLFGQEENQGFIRDDRLFKAKAEKEGSGTVGIEEEGKPCQGGEPSFEGKASE
jgi:hypothetical protein